MTTMDKIAIMMGLDHVADDKNISIKMNAHLLWERARVIAEWHEDELSEDPTTRELRALSEADLRESNEYERTRE